MLYRSELAESDLSQCYPLGTKYPWVVSSFQKKNVAFPKKKIKIKFLSWELVICYNLQKILS